MVYNISHRLLLRKYTCYLNEIDLIGKCFDQNISRNIELSIIKGDATMPAHADEHYNEFELSGLTKDDLIKFDELKEQVAQFKNNNRNTDLQQQISSELAKWKEYLRDQYRPEDSAEKSRLSNIADKVQGDIDSAFEYNDGEKVYAFLEASYQRSKEDLVYGRTLILYSEKETINKSLTFFNSEEENHKLADFIISKNIEISKEIMSDDYVTLLEIERDYINTRFQ